MRDRLVRKGLVIGIIVLFVGVSVYPAFAVKINSSTNINNNVENKDKSINEISNLDLNKLNFLMFFSMNPKFFNTMLKSYSKNFIELYKISNKDCLEKINKMVKEKLSMTLKILKIIESKGLIDSSKIKIEIEDLYLKISDISDEYNELSPAFETQDYPPIICSILLATLFALIEAYNAVVLIEMYTDSDIIRNLCFFIEEKLNSLMFPVWLLIDILCSDYPPIRSN